MALTIKKGSLFLYYCFDVAHEIKLDEIKKIFGKKPETSQLSYERLTPQYVQYKVPPLLVRLGKKEINTESFNFDASVKAKLYDFGVVTVVYQFPIKGSMDELASLTSELAENKKLAAMAREQAVKLVSELEHFMEGVQPELKYWEDYIVVSVKEFDRKLSAQELMSQASTDIAKVLRCETEKLSDAELKNALKYILSYYENELVAVDWQASFIYDPRQSYDVHDILEYAVIMLLELRAYDSQLDIALDKAYDDLDRPAGIFTPYAKTLHELTEVKLDVSEVIDKVTDSLKLIGDLYLAKVYRAASQRFYLAELQASLNEKLKTIESIYTMLFDKANNRLLVALEAMIVALFVLDIALLFAK